MTLAAGLDPRLWYLFGGVSGALALGTAVGLFLERRVTGEAARATVANINARVRGWWAMCALFGVAVVSGGVASFVFFGLVSWLALRELVTLLPTRRADHRPLLWIFYVVTPIQYWLAATGRSAGFVLFVPVVAGSWLAVRMALGGDTERFLERVATLQWGVMLCVYCVSHVPALLRLDLPAAANRRLNLLVFLVTVVELSDVLQYVWGKIAGGRRIAPAISPNKTWAGFVGGVGSATLVGTGLWWVTPFTPWQAAGVSLAVTLAGFAGGLVMSAVKRDRGIKDYGSLISGHGGVLDRIDSICFAAPVFYHLTRLLLR